MKQYLDLLEKILVAGVERPDRTNTGTIGTFGEQLKFSLYDKLPVITTKKVHLKSVVHELLWFISGNNNVKHLSKHGISIWDEWANEWGDLGPIYGEQWRGCSFNYKTGKIKDQLGEVIENIKKDPYSRRHVVSAWNVSELELMALPPCHMMYQFYVTPAHPGDIRNDVIPYYLSCHMYQRSADCFLGLPFNITSYSLLTHMVAELTNLVPHELIISIGDTHIYTNHLDQVMEQLTRDPYPEPTVHFNQKKKYKSIDDFEYDDIIISGYEHHPPIKGEIAI